MNGVKPTARSETKKGWRYPVIDILKAFDLSPTLTGPISKRDNNESVCNAYALRGCNRLSSFKFPNTLWMHQV